MAVQFVIQLDNRPGALSRLFHLLAAHGIDVQHLAGATAGAASLAVLTVSDDDRTRALLRSDGYSFSEGETLILRVRDEPGMLADITARMADAGVNISSVLDAGRAPGWVDTAFTVDDPLKARAAVVGCEAVLRR